MKKRELTKEALLSMARQQGECLIWSASKLGPHYGGVKFAGKMRRAHRVSYELHFGAIPLRMVVMHRCDNPLCIRPEHLRLGTQAENVADMWAKGRQRILTGEAHPRAKLKAEQVAAIRARYKPRSKKNGQHALAREFGVSRPVIAGIVAGTLWASIT